MKLFVVSILNLEVLKGEVSTELGTQAAILRFPIVGPIELHRVYFWVDKHRIVPGKICVKELRLQMSLVRVYF